MRARQPADAPTANIRCCCLKPVRKIRNPWIHIPLGYGRLFKEKTVNWMYQTEPEPGLNGRNVFQPRGKVLGGSSSINGLLYVRGQHEDYDRWRQHGNLGWGYDDVLPYFKKAENQTRGADDFHGVGGPLPVSDWRHADPLSAAFVDAAAQAGIPTKSRLQRRDPGRRRIFPDHDAAADDARAPRSPIFAPPRPEQSACRDLGARRSASCSRDAAPLASTIAPQASLRTARARKEILVSSGAYQLAAIVAALGRRPGGTAAPARHRCRAGCARRRPRSAGPYAGPHRDALLASHHAQRHRQ